MQSAINWIQAPKEVDPEWSVSARSLQNLDDKLRVILETHGFGSLLATQCIVWEMTHGGVNTKHDLCLCFPTGSGKTLAYLLPVLQTLYRQTSQGGIHCLRALIVLPTNTLLTQVLKVLRIFAQELGLHVGFLGSSPIAEESEMLSQTKGTNGLIDVLLSTPGRLLTHLEETEGFSLANLQYLILDEADHLIKRRHLDCLPFLIRQLPSQTNFTRVQKFVVSATLSFDVSRLKMLELHSPRLICPDSGDGLIKRRYHFPEKLKHFKLIIPAPLRPLALVGMLYRHRRTKTIVFCSTVDISQKLMELLSAISFLKGSVLECSGDLSKDRISRTVRKFQQEEFSVLVCSDLISRGMDIESVDWVLHYDTPVHAKTYIHRVGRTARVGKEGQSCCLLRKGMDQDNFQKLIEKLKIEVKELKLDIDELKVLKGELDQVLNQMKRKSKSGASN